MFNHFSHSFGTTNVFIWLSWWTTWKTTLLLWYKSTLLCYHHGKMVIKNNLGLRGSHAEEQFVCLNFTDMIPSRPSKRIPQRSSSRFQTQPDWNSWQGEALVLLKAHLSCNVVPAVIMWRNSPDWLSISRSCCIFAESEVLCPYLSVKKSLINRTHPLTERNTVIF